MNVLYITPRFPHPVLKGDQLIVSERLKELGKSFNVTLMTFYSDEKELEGIQYLEQYCKHVIPVKLTKSRIIKNVTKELLKGDLPLQVAYFENAEFGELLETNILKYNIDLVHSFTIRLAEYTRRLKVPVIYELIDSMELNIQNMIREEKLLKRWVYKLELERMRVYEKKIVSDNKFVTVVSEKDKTKIGFDHISVVPNGVDLKNFQPLDNIRDREKILFSGNMNYLPNIHAVKWFVQYCFPLILQVVPEAKFIIAGANPASSVRKLHNGKNIFVTGYVESLSKIMNECSIAVAPMRSGSGMQNKILEAMACGLPVVTTHNGLEGISANPGKDILVADTPEFFAQSVISLLNEKNAYNKISNRSREYVQKNHSWKRSNDMIIDLYLEAYPSNQSNSYFFQNKNSD